MPTYQTPGVYREDLFPAPPAELQTGAPVFLGLISAANLLVHGDRFTAPPLDAAWWIVRHTGTTATDADLRPYSFALWPEFQETFGLLAGVGYLANAVRGFFENGGRRCYVQMIGYSDETAMVTAVRAGLETLATFEQADLVCLPDIVWPGEGVNRSTWETVIRPAQMALLDHCERQGDRFALLDALPVKSGIKVEEQRQALQSSNGALYYPWLRLLDGVYAPPCGHVAGIYARTDERVGVHKAPANEVVEGALDLEINLTNAQQGELNPLGINCLRAFPGRGIRVWGARTLSAKPEWTYINVRRIFLTAGRWIERNLTGAVLEPNDARLWARIVRELTTYFSGLFQRGALIGRSAQEAFYIKCDAETNPPAVRDVGQVITEIGLATVAPSEFVVVRIMHGASGIRIE